MTKQETIEKAKILFEVLEKLPGDVDIISASVNDYFDSPKDVQIHFKSGIDCVEGTLDNPVIEEHIDSNNDIHRRVLSENCAYVQIFEHVEE